MTVSWMLWELVKNKPELVAGLDVATQRHQSGFLFLACYLLLKYCWS